MKESLIPNAQNVLLQSRWINSPPVSGITNADEFDGESEDPVEDPVVEDPVVEDPDPGAGDVETGGAGVDVTTGGVAVTVTVLVTVLSTVTWKLPVAVLPAASLEEQFTVVEPKPKDEPEAGTQFTPVEPSTRSLAEAEYVATAVEPEVLRVRLAGKLSDGGVVSSTVTWKLPEAVLPAASLAEQFTDVVPKPKVEPEAGAQLTVTEPKLSVAEAE